jgi:SAM-dependent methyltransferase
MQHERIAGSFRDPSGYVFRRGDKIFRAVNGARGILLRELMERGHLARLAKEQILVGTRFVEDAALKTQLTNEHCGYKEFLEHDVVPQITYPYEWTVSMLADAALLTLELQKRLVEIGCSLKDASAYNIQFLNGRPVFIDVSSIERPERRDLWFALGQFQRMFLFPLLLSSYRGWDLRSYFLSNLDGRTVQQVGKSFRGLQRWRPSLLWDVTLPLLLERRSDSQNKKPARVPQTHSENPAAQLLNLKRLQSKIKNLAYGYRPQSGWSDYTQTCSYDHTAETAKKNSIRTFLKSTLPETILDLGCNTGHYSELAAECGAKLVTAADADHDAVELLYRRLRSQNTPITPLVIDLANPSPAIGYMNRERASFLERFQADCVFALALVHHLLVSANFSLAAARDLFAHLSNKFLILEFVPTSDPMFQKLLRFRVNLFADLTLEQCIGVFLEKFRLFQQVSLENSPRTLLFFEKKLP